MSRALESNIWKYTVLLVANKRVWAAIVGAYYLTVPGVTPFWIGIFLLAGNGASFLFDIPSSFIADKVGHKEAIVLSRGFMLLSSVFYLLSSNIWWLIIAAILMSMGAAFMSGVGSAFMHETLRSLNREDEYRSVIGKASSIGFFIPAILASLVPFTISVSYKVPFLISLVLDVFGFIAACTLARPVVRPEHASEVADTNYVRVVRQGLALRFFRVATFSGFISAILFSVDGFRAPYQLLLNVPVVWFGVFFGVGRALAALMLAHSGRLHSWVGNLYSFERVQIIVYGVLLIVLGTVTNPWIIVAVFVLDNALRYGLGQVDMGYQLDIIRDSRFKATLLSTGNQIQNALTMLTVMVMGIAIERFGYQQSFLATAAVFFVLLIPFYFYTVRGRPVEG